MAGLESKRAARLDREQAADGVDRHDAVAVNSASLRPLYEKRQAIHPKSVSGPWRTLKWAVLAVLLAVYYALPFLRWDRPGGLPDQFAMVDFPGRRLYLGPITIWPQEMYYVTGLLIVSALGLFLATALFGRVWCGYACPQTVWTDLYIAVERLFEGDRNQRLRLAKQPWGFDKAWRKIAKHAVWLAIALATGGWFVAYFHDAPTLFAGFFSGTAPGSAYLFAGLLTFTTYALAGTMREQVCTYMCPWPRIQAALLDSDALSVAYRVDRGDPRGAHKKGETWEGRGDCVDCRACVAACPAGIDIRDGLQIECINCALCIDACDDIMVRIGRPKGLIAWDSAANVERRAQGLPARWRLVRGRTLFYGALLAGIGGLMAGSLLLRSDLDVNVLRDRAPLYVALSDGQVRNAYTVKVLNKADRARTVEVRLKGVEGAILKATGGQVAGNMLVVTAKPDSVEPVRLLVTADPARQSGRSVDVTFEAIAREDGAKARQNSVFIRGRE